MFGVIRVRSTGGKRPFEGEAGNFQSKKMGQTETKRSLGGNPQQGERKGMNKKQEYLRGISHKKA